MVHIMILVALDSLDAESEQKVSVAGGDIGFWSRLKFLEQVYFDKNLSYYDFNYWINEAYRDTDALARL